MTKMSARERAAETHKAISRAVAQKAKTPTEVAKQIGNYPGPVARAMKAMAARGELKACTDGKYAKP